jgi:signal transduction histidine kinase
MTVATSAGRREDFTSDQAATRTTADWANVRPMNGQAKGAVDGWIDLLARISHDLRTPLNAVIGFSDAMQHELFGPLGNARYQEYARHIRASGVQLLSAAEDALAMTALLAQPRAAAASDVALLALVDQVAHDLAPDCATRMVRFEIEIPAGLEVRSDPHQLMRAVRQLLSIGLSRAAAGALIEVRARADGGLVEFGLEVRNAHGDAPAPALEGSAARLELGLGRLDLAVWLAVALLDSIDCTLSLHVIDGTLRLRTVLEQSVQQDFFAAGD